MWAAVNQTIVNYNAEIKKTKNKKYLNEVHIHVQFACTRTHVYAQ